MVKNQTLFTILGIKATVLIKRWCDCECTIEESWEEEIFKDDGECKCGVIQHHYHCQKCGGLTQVG